MYILYFLSQIYIPATSFFFSFFFVVALLDMNFWHVGFFKKYFSLKEKKSFEETKYERDNAFYVFL